MQDVLSDSITGRTVFGDYNSVSGHKNINIYSIYKYINIIIIYLWESEDGPMAHEYINLILLMICYVMINDIH